MKKPGINGMGPKCYREYLREQGEKPSERRRMAKRLNRDIIKVPTLNLFSGRYNVVDHSKKVHPVEIHRGSDELNGAEFDGYIPLLELR